MNIKKLMKQAQQMQTHMEEQMSTLEVEGSAGGGAVRVTLNGKKDILSLKIDPQVLSPENGELVEEMVLAAFRDAGEKVDAEMSSMMQGFTGGLPIP
ncbi:MAG TPA: YbaB/EbfC family nucleoid-associated protein [Thermoanaerobaculia bacterium]|nr:YbaB/EbfC family nucleoid-associated protein [Thermoanaerobaculia bacterium]HUM30284.1 YbaB/EbfC family nucleoid-associated protein [Thermoanaerobaculia bacterium]HXK68420.1 YbaB/EbfC family nucleoid-associated protein [Thermoanaerobaculia bacterium]